MIRRSPRILCILWAAVVALVSVRPVETIGHEEHGERHSSTERDDSIDARYARAYLKLARMDLQKALEANKRLSGNYPTYSAVLVERLRQNVLIAEKQLQHAVSPDRIDLHSVHLRNVEAGVTIAEMNLEQAIDLKRRVPSGVSEFEIERLRLAVEVANLGLAKARDHNMLKSDLAHTQWQLELLREEILQLHMRVEKLSR